MHAAILRIAGHHTGSLLEYLIFFKTSNECLKQHHFRAGFGRARWAETP